MIRFHVNIDHIATLRNARGTSYPDPVFGAKACELAGADGITAHLREDRRHIRDDDLERLRASLSTLLNLEMAATEEMLAIAERIRPDVVTLVPERREERTTEGGLDVIAAQPAIAKIAEMCQRSGTKLSLFVEADEPQINASQKLGARQVELHTGEYCLAETESAKREQLRRLRHGAAFAHDLGLEVALGHGLTQRNLVEVVKIPQVVELNIGHALIADAVMVGLERAVHDFRAAMNAAIAARTGRP